MVSDVFFCGMMEWSDGGAYQLLLTVRVVSTKLNWYPIGTKPSFKIVVWRSRSSSVMKSVVSFP